MRLTRKHALWVLVLALLIGAGVWWSRSIEWVDIDVPTPPKKEASRDRLYAAKALVRRLGGQVSAPQSLAELPPPGATLVLSSLHWNMFPGREKALRSWVDGGGRLVIIQTAWSEGNELPGWLPIHSRSAPQRRNEPASAPAAPSGRRPAPPFRACDLVSEPDDVAGAFGSPRSFRVCGFAYRRLSSATPAQWRLDRPDGTVMLRVPFGKGSVTWNAIDGSFANQNVARDDSALAFAAALELHPGDAVWFVADEARTPLLSLLWSDGTPALLLALLAVTLALWRGAARFGPIVEEPALARRSIGEQVRRTAAYIAQGGGSALRRASARALDETARRTVAGYAALIGARERSEAIARHGAVPAATLEAAMMPSASDDRRLLAVTIARLEQARRALLPAKTSHRKPTATRP